MIKQTIKTWRAREKEIAKMKRSRVLVDNCSNSVAKSFVSLKGSESEEHNLEKEQNESDDTDNEVINFNKQLPVTRTLSLFQSQKLNVMPGTAHHPSFVPAMNKSSSLFVGGKNVKNMHRTKSSADYTSVFKTVKCKSSKEIMVTKDFFNWQKPEQRQNQLGNNSSNESPRSHVASLSKASKARYRGSSYEVVTPFKQRSAFVRKFSMQEVFFAKKEKDVSDDGRQNVATSVDIEMMQNMVNLVESVNSDFSSELSRDKDGTKAHQFFNKENTTRINIAQQKMANWVQKMKQCQMYLSPVHRKRSMRSLEMQRNIKE